MFPIVMEDQQKKQDAIKRVLEHGDWRAFSEYCPDPAEGVEGIGLSRSGLWTFEPNAHSYLNDLLSAAWFNEPLLPFRLPTPPEPMEVNMMEALLGYRAWRLREDGLLHSLHSEGIWYPDKPMEAVCQFCQESPCTSCTCGVYAMDKLEDVDDSFVVHGSVYGWGRYVRGESGWRAQYAYPKALYLCKDNVESIEALKKYHVPIFMDVPTQMYSPMEDGYEHRDNQEDWSSGAGAESDAEED